jgi:hypothetical protein
MDDTVVMTARFRRHALPKLIGAVLRLAGEPRNRWLEPPRLPHGHRQTGHHGAVDEGLALLLQRAFNARDIDTLRSLLAEDATWGEDPEGESFCHDRNDVVAHVKQLLDDGVQATIVGTTTGPRGIAVRVQVDWPAPEDQRPELQTVHQAYMVTDGLVTEIHGYDDHDSALAAISD